MQTYTLILTIATGNYALIHHVYGFETEELAEKAGSRWMYRNSSFTAIQTSFAVAEIAQPQLNFKPQDPEQARASQEFADRFKGLKGYPK